MSLNSNNNLVGKALQYSRFTNEKTRHMQIKSVSQDHTVDPRQIWDLNRGSHSKRASGRAIVTLIQFLAQRINVRMRSKILSTASTI